ncbi:MAG TPA: hypothetical protein VHE55_01150 [Fimbriimonadaceae bacterium]|nr:hypothetical protein [Fimbriimonadaceae bacterium]
MNERELHGLLKEYGDSLGSCRRPPVRTPRRSRLGYAVALCAALVAIGVAMWPQDAAAGRIARMGRAIKNAHSMEMAFLRQMRDGKWLDWMHVYYEDGMWRSEVVKGSGQAVTIVTRDGLMVRNYHRLDHAVMMPAEKLEGLPDETSALDYAEATIDSGHTSAGRTMSVRNHADVDGRKTYVVAFERPEDDYHAEILVDAATDLPMSADIQVHYDIPNGGDFRFRQEYRFNQAFDPKLFSLDPGKPVVDLRESGAKLDKRWARPIASAEDMELRDASVTSDGTIWLAVTCSETRLPMLPIRLVAAGSEYGQLFDLDACPMSAQEGSVKVEGKSVLMIGFFPLDPSIPAPPKATIFFGRRAVDLPNFAKQPGWDNVEVSDSATVPLRHESGLVPSYFPLLNMDRMTLELPADIWHRRGERLRERGKLLDAAHAYERSAKEYENFVKYIGYRELDLAAQCYDKLGLVQEAAADRARSAALRAGRER